MFGFLKKTAAREHLKLMYQNNLAVEYIQSFDAELANSLRAQVEAVSSNWTPGKPIPDDLVGLMLNANKALRRIYDQTPAKLSKTFDQEYQPIMGWKKYYENFE